MFEISNKIASRIMKTPLTLLSALALCAAVFAGICFAESPSAKFVRVANPVTLDIQGSTLEFPVAKDGRQSFSVTWVAGTSRETFSVIDKGFFKRDGWFVYIESPTRIWTFDGERQLDLVVQSKVLHGRYSVAHNAVFETCPAAVWDAVPDSVRKSLRDQRAR